MQQSLAARLETAQDLMVAMEQAVLISIALGGLGRPSRGFDCRESLVGQSCASYWCPHPRTISAHSSAATADA